jgi:molybdate transport system ATP-binding protein
MSGLSVTLRDRLGGFELDVSFEAPARGVTALFGRSGSGKTSVLRAVAGLVQTSEGKVSLNGELWQNQRYFIATHKRPIGYVFQEASLFPHLSVSNNLQYGWRRVPSSQQRIAYDEAVELLGIGPLLQRDPHRLSGGERQRVAIARALLTSPRLLLMDEPLSALDHDAKRSILPYLERLHNELGIPSLYVSHDPDEVARLADYMLILEQGRVQAAGPANDILTRLDLPLSRVDEASSIIEGEVSAHDTSYNLTWISTQGGHFSVSHYDLPVGRRARIQVHAKDVSLSLSAHHDTSILNILPVQVMDSQDINPSQMLVRLRMVDGQTLLARITRRSAAALGIHNGMLVHAQIKSVALVA